MGNTKFLINDLRELTPPQNPLDSDSFVQLSAIYAPLPINTRAELEYAQMVLDTVRRFVHKTKTEDEGILLYRRMLNANVRDYEDRRLRALGLTGREMLAYLMKEHGLTQVDLAIEMGGQSIVSKVLSGERELNLRQVKALAKRFKVSPEVFIT